MSGRERFLFGLMTTSPQCLGTLPSAPEEGRLDCERVAEAGVVGSPLCDWAGDAEIGVWRVA
jgi:hypothetical protein